MGRLPLAGDRARRTPGRAARIALASLDLEGGELTLRRNYIRANGEGHDEDTKSYQMRRLSIDAVTVHLLRSHRAAAASALALLQMALTDSGYVLSAAPDRSRPRDLSSMTRRYQRMVKARHRNASA